jgi:hypothetical protein
MALLEGYYAGPCTTDMFSALYSLQDLHANNHAGPVNPHGTNTSCCLTLHAGNRLKKLCGLALQQRKQTFSVSLVRAGLCIGTWLEIAACAYTEYLSQTV